MLYTDLKKKYFIHKLVIFAVLVFVCILSIPIGIAKIDAVDTVRILASKIPVIGKNVNVDNIPSSAKAIILNIRAPRIVMAVFVGMGLSLSGAVYQGMFKNQMADPYVLGISSGAAFFASIAIVFFSGLRIGVLGSVYIFAFIGSVLTTILVYMISRTGGRLPAATLLLTGVAFHFLMSAGINFLLMFNREMADRVVLWNMGSFSNSSWTSVAITVPVVVVCSIIIIFNAKNLNILSVDEPTAKSLGVDVERNKTMMLVVTALIVAVCVSSCGVVGFVGLVIPHITRILYRPDHRVLLPFSALFGSLFLVLCDLVARNLLNWLRGFSSEMPVGAITSAFGAPFFIWLLIKKKRNV